MSEILLTQRGDARVDETTLRQMHRLRHAMFHDRLGWGRLLQASAAARDLTGKKIGVGFGTGGSYVPWAFIIRRE